MPAIEPAIDPESRMRDVYRHPGHLLRRAQQIAVSMFYDELGKEVTPVQYAILRTLSLFPGIDQVSLAGLVAIDTSTGATVCVRLEEKGLLSRPTMSHNRHQRALHITEAGQRLLATLDSGAEQLRERLLAPLTIDEQEHFMRLLSILVHVNNPHSRAPLATADAHLMNRAAE